MPLAISTNIAAEKANYYLGYNANKMQESIKRLASGKKLTSPVQDPGNLAVSMKLSASLNRLSGAMNNAQNGMSFLEVQDGMLETVGKILDRMSELKGLSSQDPMKSEMDKFSYNNEFKDLQLQLYAISQEEFNGVSLFANYSNRVTSNEALFYGKDQGKIADRTHQISIHTSQNGSSGAKVSINKAILLSALTLKQNGDLAGTTDHTGHVNNTNNEDADWSTVKDLNHLSTGANALSTSETTNNWVTLANDSLDKTLSVDMISVGVLTTALENVAFLRAQNGGSGSRLSFSYEALAQQRTNMRAALGRMVDVDVAEESTNLSKYNVLSQAAAAMIAQANSTSELALILLR
jgi:flagellin